MIVTRSILHAESRPSWSARHIFHRPIFWPQS